MLTASSLKSNLKNLTGKWKLNQNRNAPIVRAFSPCLNDAVAQDVSAVAHPTRARVVSYRLPEHCGYLHAAVWPAWVNFLCYARGPRPPRCALHQSRKSRPGVAANRRHGLTGRNGTNVAG
jgi:hypothetical protein